MKDRTITCNSLSKTYSITGWRLGYTQANPQITDRIKKVHDFLTVGAAHPLQEAAVTGLRFGDEYYADLQKFLRGMWELVLCQVHLFLKKMKTGMFGFTLQKKMRR